MHIILLLLKIIGWLLLIVLGLIVLVACLVLFTPLRYQVRAKCDGDVSSLAAEANFSVFFHLVRASVRYVDQKLSWQLGVAWKKFSSEPKEESVDEIKQEVGHAVKDVAEDVKQAGEEIWQGESVQQAVETVEKEEPSSTTETSKADAATTPVVDEIEEKADATPENIDQTTSPPKAMDSQKEETAPPKIMVSQREETPPKAASQTKAPRQEKALPPPKEKSKEEKSKKGEDKQRESVFSKIQSIIEKLKCTFREICDKIETLKKKKDVLTDFITNEAHVGALKKVLAELKRLLRRLLPKKFQADVHFGFEDPSITGRVLAGISMIYPAICEHTQICPDFQQKVLEGNVFIKGHVRACIFTSMGIRLLLNANVRRTLLDVKNFSFDV